VTNLVGGESPAVSDAIINGGSGSYGSLSAGGRVPQSITTASPAANNSTITGIDFGFNFDTRGQHPRRDRLQRDQLELSLPGLAAPVHHQFERAGR
jgi:hypothetical protein